MLTVFKKGKRGGPVNIAQLFHVNTIEWIEFGTKPGSIVSGKAGLVKETRYLLLTRL